jgi:hypothetical protein
VCWDSWAPHVHYHIHSQIADWNNIDTNNSNKAGYCLGPASEKRRQSLSPKSQPVSRRYLINSEKEHHILRGEGLCGFSVGVDSRVNQVSFPLLEFYNAALNGILDTKSGDCAWTGLANSMASIGGLPFCRRVPPAEYDCN